MFLLTKEWPEPVRREAQKVANQLLFQQHFVLFYVVFKSLSYQTTDMKAYVSRVLEILQLNFSDILHFNLIIVLH